MIYAQQNFNLVNSLDFPDIITRLTPTIIWEFKKKKKINEEKWKQYEYELVKKLKEEIEKEKE